LKSSFRDDHSIASAQLWLQDQSSALLGEKFVSDRDESIHVILSNLIQQLTDSHLAPRLVMAQRITSDVLLSQSEVRLSEDFQTPDTQTSHTDGGRRLETSCRAVSGGHQRMHSREVRWKR
jgi:hypothetical protein